MVMYMCAVADLVLVIWLQLPAPSSQCVRRKQKGIFGLVADMTIPTQQSYYPCVHAHTTIITINVIVIGNLQFS